MHAFDIAFLALVLGAFLAFVTTLMGASIYVALGEKPVAKPTPRETAEANRPTALAAKPGPVFRGREAQAKAALNDADPTRVDSPNTHIRTSLGRRTGC